MILGGKANSKPLVMYDFTIRLKKYISTCKKYKHADISKEKSRKWLSATARAERGEGWKARARRERGRGREGGRPSPQLLSCAEYCSGPFKSAFLFNPQDYPA